jgi:hypothetical protein
MANKAAIVKRAAIFLGVVGLDAAVPASHNKRIEAGYDAIYKRLQKKGLATWKADGEAPDDVIDPVAALIADNCLNTYSVSADRYARIKAEAGTALSLIGEAVIPDYTSNDDPTDY